MVQCILNYTKIFVQNYSVRDPRTQTRDIAHVVAASHPIQKAILSFNPAKSVWHRSCSKFLISKTSSSRGRKEVAGEGTSLSLLWIPIAYYRLSTRSQSYWSWLQIAASTVPKLSLHSQLNISTNSETTCWADSTSCIAAWAESRWNMEAFLFLAMDCSTW